MSLAYRLPAPALAGIANVHFTFRAGPGGASVLVPALLPNIHLVVRGTVRYRFADGRELTAPPVGLLGATHRAIQIDLSQDAVLAGVGLLPEGWPRLLGEPASLLADTLTDARLLWPCSAVDTLAAQVAEAADDAARAGAVDVFLARIVAACTVAPDPRAPVVERWIERCPSLSLDALARRLDLGARQTARLTAQVYGTCPKTLAMKYRALRGATLLAVNGASALEEAMDGYADQSHMIRDFRRFVGATPTAFLRDGAPIAAATIRGRWAAGVRRPISLWS